MEEGGETSVLTEPGSAREQRLDGSWYLKDLGLTWEDLRGRSILELGAGPARLGQLAKARGIDLVSLDSMAAPVWKLGDWTAPKDVPFVKADAFRLPFPDDHFDLVLARATVPTLTDSKERAVAATQEIMRVLKAGGEARMYPGCLNANVFEDDELWSAREQRHILAPKYTDERMRRIAQRSLEFMRSIVPQVRREPVADGDAHDAYYSVVK